MTYAEDVERWRQQDAVKEVVEAARAWAPTRFTRTGSGTKDRLVRAVAALEGVDVEDLYSAIYDRGCETGREQERAVWHG